MYLTEGFSVTNVSNSARLGGAVGMDCAGAEIVSVDVGLVARGPEPEIEDDAATKVLLLVFDLSD